MSLDERLPARPLFVSAMVLLLTACDSSAKVDGDGGAPDGGGTDGEAGTMLLECFAGNGETLVVTLANPTDFSVNTVTSAHDQHNLVITAGDFFSHRTVYTTGGSANHQHEVRFTAEEIAGIQTNVGFPTVAETGPPLNDATGHTHTVQLTHCGLPGS